MKQMVQKEQNYHRLENEFRTWRGVLLHKPFFQGAMRVEGHFKVNIAELKPVRRNVHHIRVIRSKW